jgi:F-type H+-transporting ATPase subunit epsilon
MAETLDLTLVTPERSLIQRKVDEVQVPGLGGYLGLLPGHAPLFSELHVGELVYTLEGEAHSIAIAGGFVEVLDDEVRILADVAEPAGEIDVERATQARDRADTLISGGGEDVDYPRAIAALNRAAVRVQVAGKRR